MSLLDSMMDALSVAPHTHKCIDQNESACADQCVRCAVQKLTALKPEGGMSLLDSLEEQKKEIDRLTKELEAAVKVGYVAEANVRARDIAVKHAMERAEKAEAACQVKQGVHPSWVNEVARLREENAALKQEARILPPAREKAMRDMMLSNNTAVDELLAAKAVLERARTAIAKYPVYAKAWADAMSETSPKQAQRGAEACRALESEFNAVLALLKGEP